MRNFKPFVGADSQSCSVSSFEAVKLSSNPVTGGFPVVYLDEVLHESVAVGEHTHCQGGRVRIWGHSEIQNNLSYLEVLADAPCEVGRLLK